MVVIVKIIFYGAGSGRGLTPTGPLDRPGPLVVYESAAILMPPAKKF